MIIPEDQLPSKKDLEANSERAQVVHEDDPPPMYFGPGQESEIPSTSTACLERYVPNERPSNFISISKINGAVQGTWVINPGLVLPSALLPPLEKGETEETRKNLSLDSRNGAIDADVYVLPPPSTSSALVKPRQRVTVHAKSWNGAVTVKLHDLQDPDTSRLPIHVACHTTNGAINVYIPRSFRGIINIKTKNGSPRYSEAVRNLIVPISDIHGVHRSFMGQFDPSQWEGDSEWLGDELNAESWNGSVKVFFEDEADANMSSSTATRTTMKIGRSQSFFGKLFSF
ncbi:hypothetical protein CVT26_009060 [Gymnopilus dilepis]|uniref:DUF7330 domain-containing protein n=1 Tax=Gymnopilus dilepis TaxID=231916 RepID=A0A409YR72_9AGAR|nr:hypothetical protein CVT26_009060 [Gymnopilus dilepis]